MLRPIAIAAACAAALAWARSEDPHADGSTNVLVVYEGSGSGAVQELAEAIGAGAESEGASVKVVEVADANYKRHVYEWADAVLLGSPVLNGNVAPPMLAFINSFDFTDDLSTKVGGAFAAGGGAAAGLESVLQGLNRGMKVFGMVTVGGSSWRSVDGLGAVTSHSDKLEDGDYTLHLAREQGSRVAKLAGTVKRTSGKAGGVDAPSQGVLRVLESVTWSLGKAKWTNASVVRASCEMYCRGSAVAAGCGTCRPGAFSFSGGESLCLHPGPTGTGMLCRVDQTSGETTDEPCCGAGGPCTLPLPTDAKLEQGGDWPGACCNTAGGCGNCPGGSPPSQLFPLLDDRRTLSSSRRWFDRAANVCSRGAAPPGIHLIGQASQHAYGV